MLRALIAAQDSIDANRACKPAIVRVLIDEIIRLRRLLQAQDNRIRKLEGGDGMDLHGSGDSQRPAPGEGRFVRGKGEDVDPIDG